MSLFDNFINKKTNSTQVVWRNEDGVIECKGDSCPVDCDMSCPIYMNTIAAGLYKIGEYEKAEEKFNDILKIAPDFYDPWNSLGVINGLFGNYKKAHEYYGKAHEIKPERPAAIIGLALTSRDLGLYEECLEWCELYESMTHDNRLLEAKRTACAALGKPVPEERKVRF